MLGRVASRLMQSPDAYAQEAADSLAEADRLLVNNEFEMAKLYFRRAGVYAQLAAAAALATR